MFSWGSSGIFFQKKDVDMRHGPKNLATVNRRTKSLVGVTLEDNCKIGLDAWSSNLHPFKRIYVFTYLRRMFLLSAVDQKTR